MLIGSAVSGYIGSAVSGYIDTLLEVQLVDTLIHYWKCS